MSQTFKLAAFASLFAMSASPVQAFVYKITDLEGTWSCITETENPYTRTDTIMTVSPETGQDYAGLGTYDLTMSVDGEDGVMVIDVNADVTLDLVRAELVVELVTVEVERATFDEVLLGTDAQTTLENEILNDGFCIYDIRKLTSSELVLEDEGVFAYCERPKA